MINKMENKSLTLLYEILRNTKEENKNILKSCYKKAGIKPPKYKSFMAQTNFFSFDRGDILTFNLINTPILENLGFYLIGIREKLYISYYNEEKKAFIIDENKEPIPTNNATIEGILARINKGREAIIY